jgi:hypothetical protein
LGLLLPFALALPLTALAAGASAPDASAVTPGQQVEINISNNAAGGTGTTTMGEPEIAQNPLNRDNLFIDWNTFRYPATNMTPVPNPCGGMASKDRGATWQPAPLPLSSCADAIAAFGADGTLYAGGIVVTSATIITPNPFPNCPSNSRAFAGVCLVVHGYDAIVSSTDSGQTWSPPVKIMGSQVSPPGPFPFAPNSGNPSDTFDRPWLSIDQSTGTIYAAGHNIVDHETFVTASTDGGQTFGTIYAADSPDYPSNGLPSGTVAAANGVLAVAYTAASAPGARTCPCVIFETSTDNGATFTRHVVPSVNAAGTPRPFVAADPTGRGRFALTILDSTGTQNQVYTTRDFGQSWQGPTDVGETPPNPQFKPWLSYSPSGQLALAWRTYHGTPGTAPYDVWTAVGRDQGANGAVFSSPVRVTSVSAPYPPLNPGGQGDDFSFVLADNQYLHVGWGDSRNGRTEAWYGRISLPTFKGQP